MIVTRFLKAQAVVVVDDNLLEVLMMMVIQVIVMVAQIFLFLGRNNRFVSSVKPEDCFDTVAQNL